MMRQPPLQPWSALQRHLRLTKWQAAPLVPKSVAGVAAVLMDLRSDDAHGLTNKETE